MNLNRIVRRILIAALVVIGILSIWWFVIMVAFFFSESPH
jgi:hypothetical protein